MELKARYESLREAANQLSDAGATLHGRLNQLDTYFEHPTHRLKLREQTPGDTHLISYQRDDELGYTTSRYSIQHLPDESSVAAVLAVHRAVTQVKKTRTLFWFENVRIHLDEVRDLGSFIEFEAVANSESEAARCRGKLDRLFELLRIRPDLCVAESYSDLIEMSTEPK